MLRRWDRAMDQLLSIDEAAEILGTTARFPRRLVSERRIRFVKVGRHVRIPASALIEFIQEGTIEPITIRRRRGRSVA
jgi:excisionase family DNA binding protein